MCKVWLLLPQKPINKPLGFMAATVCEEYFPINIAVCARKSACYLSLNVVILFDIFIKFNIVSCSSSRNSPSLATDDCFCTRSHNNVMDVFMGQTVLVIKENGDKAGLEPG